MNINQIKTIITFKANNIICEIKRAKQVFIYKKKEKNIFIIILLNFYKSKVYLFKIYKKTIYISLFTKNIS